MRISVIASMVVVCFVAGASGVLAGEKLVEHFSMSSAKVQLTDAEKTVVQNYLKQTLKGRLPEDSAQAQKMIDEEIKAREKMVKNIEHQMPKADLLSALMKWSAQEVLVNTWMYEQQELLRLAVLEKELKDDYEVMYPMERHVDLILAVYKDEKKAQTVLERAQKGEPLSQLAKQSDDSKIAQMEGKFDALPLQSLPKQLQQLMDVKNIGSLVPSVVKTEYGFMVVQLMDVKDQRAKTFESAREELLNARVQMQMKQRMEKVLFEEEHKDSKEQQKVQQTPIK